MASYQYNTSHSEFLTGSTTGNHVTFGYTGYCHDRDLNHHYAKIRYYNPSTLRRNICDTQGMIDVPKVYAYVRGNVVDGWDELGLLDNAVNSTAHNDPLGFIRLLKKITSHVFRGQHWLP